MGTEVSGLKIVRNQEKGVKSPIPMAIREFQRVAMEGIRRNG